MVTILKQQLRINKLQWVMSFTLHQHATIHSLFLSTFQITLSLGIFLKEQVLAWANASKN